MSLLFVGSSVAWSSSASAAGSLSLCGNPGPAPSPPKHVIVLMMENLSYNNVVGSKNAPFQTSLASQCGVATNDFAATHTSAANYLAVSAGEFPPSSPPGCGSRSACLTSADNLYSQMTRAGLRWTGYMESMPGPCYPSNYGTNTKEHTLYGVGHNPPVFYTRIPDAECKANDVGVADLTAQSGVFWDALQNQTLPEFSFITPNTANDNEGPGGRTQGEITGDAFLQNFVATVQQSNSYQAGDTLLLIAYDEGIGKDAYAGEDCTNLSLDLPVTNGVSAHQDSCHVPLFVLYPYTSSGDHDATFFDHYSITKTVERIFGLPYLSHANDAQTVSLVGHFGITASHPESTSPTVSIATPTSGSAVSGSVTVSGTAADDIGVAQVVVGVDGGSWQPASGTTDWTATFDTTTVSDGPHSITVQATDGDGHVGTSSVQVTVNNAPNVPPTASATTSCTNLVCTFDGSASTDTDGTVTGYAWTFGDGSTGSGRQVSHTYATAGSFDYTLTVTDNEGASSQAFAGSVTTTTPPPATLGFRGVTHAYVKTATSSTGASVAVPAAAQAGDMELLFVVTPAVDVTGTPAGWTRLGQQNSAPLQTTVYTRTSSGTDAGTAVLVPVLSSTTVQVQLQLAAYSGVGSGMTVVGSADATTATHTTPPASVTVAGAWVVSFWSDKSSTTTAWTLPSGVTARDITIGSGGGHVSGALTDSGRSVAVGTYPALTATVTGGASGKGAMLTLVLPPQN